MQIISKNSKTGYSINFPIEQTCDKTCPFYQNRTCYGLKGRFLFKNVQQANAKRLALYLDDPNTYWGMFHAELTKLRDKGVTHIRINGIGDTPDESYADMIVFYTFAFPEIKFWVATRKSFWQGRFLPDNLVVRFSDGVDGLLTSNVTNKIEEATCPATVKGSGVHTCAECGHKCWSSRLLNVTYNKH